MVRRIILFLILTVFSFYEVKAQGADTIAQPEVYYSSPKTYKLAGIEVTGVADHYDPETLIQLSGMSVGSEVKIPGDVTTRAIKRLYSNGLFSDVSISVDRIVGNEIYLILHLKERQKWSKKVRRKEN